MHASMCAERCVGAGWRPFGSAGLLLLYLYYDMLCPSASCCYCAMLANASRGDSARGFWW